MKVLISEDGRKYLWNGGNFQSKYGTIKENKIKDGILKTNLGKKFVCFDASFADRLVKIKRGPAIMLKKDIGNIVASTGVNKNSRVLDAGSGCGVLASFLAMISKHVTSYEKNKEFFKIAKNNFKMLGADVKIKNKDVYKGI
ncbi:MAG: rRNA adenine N-6-methyltransferase family protein, partial [Nanoarchaeota archaeon]